MNRTLEVILIICSLIGAMEISYVESRIIAKSGELKIRSDLLPTIYWNQLSKTERCLFWTGLPLLAAPFVLAFTG